MQPLHVKMQLATLVTTISVLFSGWQLQEVSPSTVSFRGPTGIKNRHNICYMNALLSSLYDVTPFRKVGINGKFNLISYILYHTPTSLLTTIMRDQF